jgi:hypothetical protein
MLYQAEIWLDEDNICNDCPCHDLNTDEHPQCRLGKFWMRQENRGKGTPNWVTPKPAGCPLKRVEVKNDNR